MSRLSFIPDEYFDKPPKLIARRMETLAEVVAAVDQAFTPDLRLVRRRTSLYFRPDSALASARALFRQICAAAYTLRAEELKHDGRRPLYAVDAIGRKLWDELIDDSTLDLFSRASAGMTVEYTDENESP